MKKHVGFLITITFAVLAAGCSGSRPGTTRSLGDVQYQLAFAAAQEALSQHFSVASADPDTGIIESRPKLVSARPERLLTGSPARELATMHIRKAAENEVVAYLEIAVERLGTVEHHRAAVRHEKYDSVPNQTPAEIEAATTPEQNEVWTIDKYDHRQEQAILDELYRTMHREK